MTVALLVISHDGIGPAVLGTATMILRESSMPTKLLNVSRDSSSDDILDHAMELISELDQGDGVLVITDHGDSETSEIAQQLMVNSRVSSVTGLNLAMLISVLSHADLSLPDLVNIAMESGKSDISQISVK